MYVLQSFTTVLLNAYRSHTAGAGHNGQVHGLARRSTCIANGAASVCELQRQQATRVHVDSADVERNMSSSIVARHVTDLFHDSEFTVGPISYHRQHVTAQLETRPFRSSNRLVPYVHSIGRSGVILRYSFL